MGRSRRYLRSVTALAVVAAGCGASPRVLLDNGTSGSAFVCQPASDQLPWSTIRSRPTLFGLDYFTVHGPVVIDSITPTGGGGLTITTAAFVKGGGVGSGSFYGDVTYTASPASWASRIDMPDAHLPASATDNEAESWELVIGVTPDAAGGSADGVKVTYHDSVGQQFVALGRDGFALWPEEAPCRDADTSS